MIYFLTSSTCMPDSPALNPANGFADELKKALPGRCRALFIASNPDDDAKLRRFVEAMEYGFSGIGIRFSEISLLFGETRDECDYLLAHSDVIFLCGGHVPTQNRFFQEIALRERLAGWDGVLVGVSAGSMNAAGEVYAQPEEPGEAVDPDYQRWLPGLGLTGLNIIPHYNQDKDWTLDGMRLYEDITYADSMGHRFYVLVDGSFILGKDGREELRGEAYLIENGSIRQISREGEVIPM